jgi:hypothetical protein
MPAGCFFYYCAMQFAESIYANLDATVSELLKGLAVASQFYR